MASVVSAVAYNEGLYDSVQWAQIQRLVGVVDDGIPGPLTAAAVMDWQRENGLTADGMVGPMTLSAMQPAVDINSRPREVQNFVGTSRFPAKPYEDHGYDSVRLRTDVGEKYLGLWDHALQLGGYLTSAGGLRSLGSSVSANRSATSLHYLGRAFDLATYSALVDLEEDPFVCVHEHSYWRVYLRVTDASVKPVTLECWTYKGMDRGTGPKKVTDRFIDFTALALEHGFRRIPMRRSFWDGNRMGAEWWHFQYEKGLEPGVTRFGDELKRVWTLDKLEDAPPWRYRNRIWDGGRFA